MPHPFFDAVTFPLNRPEAVALLAALSAGQRNPGRIELAYQTAGGTQPLTPNLAADLAWREVLMKLATARLLRKLCDQLLADTQLGSVHPAVRGIVEAPDPLTAPLLSTVNQVFLDRKALRAQLTSLADETSPNRVLLVRGPSGVGKSWTELLVADVARNLGAECVYLFQGQVGTVEDVVDNLFAAIGSVSAVPPRVETEDAWFRKVCLKLQEQARQAQKLTWVVADDLGEYPEGPRLAPDIRRFFDQFALSMANPAFARWFRLVLLDYPDGSVPTRWRSFWVEDRPTELDVHVEPVKEYLVAWANRAAKQLAEEKAAALAADILAKVTQPAPPTQPGAARLKRIHDELEAVLATL